MRFPKTLVSTTGRDLTLGLETRTTTNLLGFSDRRQAPQAGAEGESLNKDRASLRVAPTKYQLFWSTPSPASLPLRPVWPNLSGKKSPISQTPQLSLPFTPLTRFVVGGRPSTASCLCLQISHVLGNGFLQGTTIQHYQCLPVTLPCPLFHRTSPRVLITSSVTGHATILTTVDLSTFHVLQFGFGRPQCSSIVVALAKQPPLCPVERAQWRPSYRPPQEHDQPICQCRCSSCRA